MEINSPTNLIKKIETSSVGFVRIINEQVQKGNHGSGCLLSFDGKLYLLTVEHVGRKKNLHLVLRWDQERRQTAHREFESEWRSYVRRAKCENETELENLSSIPTEYFDLAYFKYPFSEVPALQKLTENGEIIEEDQCMIFPESSCKYAREGVLYGFGGHTDAVLNDAEEDAEAVKRRLTKFRVHCALTYIGRENDDYVFKLPATHPGHEYFIGCSGSPIIDSDGNVVALVSGGDEKDDLIFGVPIMSYLLVISTQYLLENGLEQLPPHLDEIFRPPN